MPVYFIQSGNDGPVKIGFTKDARRRLAELQTGHAAPLRLLHLFDGSETEEAALHVRFAEHRQTGEWFSPAPEVLAADVGLPPLRVATPPRAPNSRWSDEGYQRFLVKLARRETDPAAKARRQASAIKAGAVTVILNSLKEIEKALPHYREAAASRSFMAEHIAKRALRLALARIEGALTRCPDAVGIIREQAAKWHDRKEAVERMSRLRAALRALVSADAA